MVITLLPGVDVGHLGLLCLMRSQFSLLSNLLFTPHEIINLEASFMRTVLEFIFEHFFEEVAELILSFEDYLLLCWVHININLLSGDVYR